MSEPTWTVTIYGAAVTIEIHGATDERQVRAMLVDELRAIHKDTGLLVQYDPARVEVVRDE